MIKLNELQDRVFSIEMPDGSIKKYDIISLGKKIYKTLGVELMGASGDVDPSMFLDKIDDFKKLFELDITDSQMMDLLINFVSEFEVACGDMESDIKKKQEAKSVASQGSSVVDSKKQQDSAPKKD